MSVDLFPAAVALVMREESRHSDHPADPGGDTWYGLARRFHPEITVWPPTREHAIEVYRADYWERCRCDALPWSLALALLDGAVQHGDATARVMMQAAAGVRADGNFGPVTLAALATGRADVLDRFCAARGVLYGRLDRFPVFGSGWMNRLMAVHRWALAGPVDEVPG